MNAKFVNENILKGKSEEDILNDLESTNIDPDDLLVRSADNGFLAGVKMALERGANVHIGNDVALRFASKGGHIEVVKLLLENGANIHARDDDALKRASKFRHTEVVNLLKKYMNKE